MRLEHFSTSNVSFFKWKAQYSVGDFCNVKNSFLVEHFHSGADRGAEDVVGSSSASVTTTGPRVCLPPGEQVQISMAVAAVPPLLVGGPPVVGGPGAVPSTGPPSRRCLPRPCVPRGTPSPSARILFLRVSWAHDGATPPPLCNFFRL